MLKNGGLKGLRVERGSATDQDDRDKPHSLQRKALLVRLMIAFSMLLVLFVLYRLLQESGVLEMITDSDRLRSEIQALGLWGPASVIGLMTLAVVLNPIPSAPIALASGAVFGHLWGTLYIVLGAEAGALIAFSIARLVGHDTLQRLFGARVSLGWLGSQNALTIMVFTSRLLPFVSFDLVSYGAGLTLLKFWRFAVATLFGLVPASFLLAHFGGELSTDRLGGVASGLLLLGLLTLIPVVIRMSKRR